LSKGTVKFRLKINSCCKDILIRGQLAHLQLLEQPQGEILSPTPQREIGFASFPDTFRLGSPHAHEKEGAGGARLAALAAAL
jgi:hypothetical protein